MVLHNRPSIAGMALALVLPVAIFVSSLVSAFPAQAQEADPVRVVATFSILADWVAEVGGDDIALTTIVPAGGDAHTFDPSPDQLASIAEADLIFEIGLGFETWLDDMVEASGTSAQRVAVSEGMTLLTADEGHSDEGGEDESHADGEEHEAGEYDPHVWGNVANAMQAVAVINAQLNGLDPGNAAAYDANAAAYQTELANLDASIRSATSALPEAARKLVTTHDTFGYYADAYGFEVVGTALSSISTEGGDPPASEIAALVSEIQDQGVPAIFAENVGNDDLMQTIADEAGVTLAPPLYTDALGEPGSTGATYIAMMTANTETIVTSLGG